LLIAKLQDPIPTSLPNNNVERKEAAMKTKAAVAIEKGKPLVVTEVNLEGPKAGEVLVEVKATAFATPTSSRSRAQTPKDFFRPSWDTRVPASSSMSGRE